MTPERFAELEEIDAAHPDTPLSAICMMCGGPKGPAGASSYCRWCLNLYPLGECACCGVEVTPRVMLCKSCRLWLNKFHPLQPSKRTTDVECKMCGHVYYVRRERDRSKALCPECR